MDGLCVVGPPRCSQSLVAFALAQHPGTRLDFDATWALGLGRGVLAVGTGGPGPRRGQPADLPAATVAARTGAFTASLTATEPTSEQGTSRNGTFEKRATPHDTPVPVSWATVSSLGDVGVLAAMFPDAVVVPVLRNPDAAVESLATKACGDGLFASRSAGYRLWTEGTQALEVLIRAWGTDRAVPVDLADLVADPDGVLKRPLGAAGLDPDPACATVFAGIDATEPPQPPTGPSAVRDVALAEHRRARDDTWSVAHAGDDPHALQALADALARAAGPGVPSFDDTASRYRAMVSLAVPDGAYAAVISKGDPGLVDVPGRVCAHLPAGPDGGYVGYHPADSAEARAGLDRARDAGVRWLVVPAASAWWLDHYADFADHVRATSRLVAHHEDIATVYELVDRAHPAGAYQVRSR